MWAALALALQLFIFPTRRLMLAQALFFGGGAYLFAILATRFQLPTWAAAVCAVVITAGAGALIARGVDRAEGHVFAIITIALSLVFGNVITAAADWTGGASGISQIPSLDLFGWTVFSYGNGVIVLAVLGVGAALLLHRVSTTSFGHKIDVSRQNDLLAASWGLSSRPLRVFLLAASAFVAAGCGVVYASVTTAIAPESFTLWTSFQPVVYIVVAGIATRFAPALAAFALTWFLDLFQFGGSWTQVLYGALLVGVIVVVPGGLGPWLVRLARGRTQRTRASSSPVPSTPGPQRDPR
jgi:branched-chain amino acid transport system permease protein